MPVINIESWMERGDQLECFSNRLEQARYYNAWDNGDLPYVLRTLETIFTRIQRMPAINWLNCPDLVQSGMNVEDLPSSLMEDWEDTDFAVRHPLGQAMSPKWLLQENVWDEILAGITRGFIFMKPGDK